MAEKIKIVLTGSKTWQNQTKIKDTIFDLKNRLKKNLFIISGGITNGADKIIKKTCLDFEIDYEEIPPFHQNWNSFCSEPAFKYNKKYSPKNFYVQNSLLVENGDIIIIFMSNNDNNSNMIGDIIKKAKEKNKKLIVIKEKIQ